jgi:molybdopterin biosynthesis enzyme MoaB
LRACTLCSRVARGFYYTHQLRPDRYPTYPFCSLRCLNAGTAIAKRNHGVIDKTELEIQAIKAARRNFAEVLTELGLMASFHDRTPEEIDRIIEACIDGFQEAMRRETLNDDIPF